MKRPLVLSAVACLAIITGSLIAVTAVSSGAPASQAGTDRQVREWRLTADHVVSGGWQSIDESPGPSPSVGFTVNSTGLITLTVSATLSGAPVEIRWLDNGTVKAPSYVSFTPTGDRSGFSYTFADSGLAKTCGHTLVLQWRSPSKRMVSLSQGDAVINYEAVPGPADTCSHG
jgi:hypothetical protein